MWIKYDKYYICFLSWIYGFGIDYDVGGNILKFNVIVWCIFNNIYLFLMNDINWKSVWEIVI